MTASVVVLLLAVAAVVCFVAHAMGWPRGLGFGLACTVAAAVLIPSLPA